LKIIDFKKKGNVVRFYLGDDDDDDYYGDDWDDRPYEHNAGPVYDEYIKGILDVAFPFDWYVLEPAVDWSYRSNSPFSKDDFKNRNAPCLVCVPWAEMSEEDIKYNIHSDEYTYWAANDHVMRIYFGDPADMFKKCKYASDLSLTWTV